MSIAKPFTFVAGQKARANEVNADFDTLYTQVNINIADIAQLDRDIDNVSATKANINGSSTQRFAVANPVSSTDAVNKQTMNKSLTNVLDFINGLTIEKDSASPNDTILINPGSCYDSTKQVVFVKSLLTSKQNVNQGASTTYYVYIIGNETGSSIDIVISNNSVEPTLPIGYTRFRKIGSFTTDSSKHIDKISSYSNSVIINQLEVIDAGTPDMNRRVNMSSGYTTPAPGFINFIFKTSGDDPHYYVYIDGIKVYEFSRGGDFGKNKYNSFFATVGKGSRITWTLTQCDTSSSTFQFIYSKGA